MFHFKRRTLWIIIYLTIPIIIILNNIGPTDNGPEPRVELTADNQPRAESSAQNWSLDSLSLECEDQVCLVPLASAKQTLISVILSRVPSESIDVPAGVSMHSRIQGRRMLIDLSFAQSDFDSALAFLANLIPFSKTNSIVVTGDLPITTKTKLTEILATAQGGSTVFDLPTESSLGLLTSPDLGSAEQLAFLVWIDVLNARLVGYETQVKWDHRDRPSRVRFNTTLSADVFYPVSDTEFEPIRSAYLTAAKQRQRNQSQIHRYAVTSVLYDIPLTFFVRQPERLQALTLKQINTMREFSLGQITKIR